MAAEDDLEDAVPPTLHKVDNVNEAIALAREFQKTGRYNWFRGQVNAGWSPYSTSYRRWLEDPEKIRRDTERQNHFLSWLASS